MTAFSSITDSDFDQFCVFLKDISGITLGKEKQYLVSSRLRKIMRKQETNSLLELAKRAKFDKRSGGLIDQIVDAMTTRETLWFRDNHPFEILRNHILPELRDKEHKSALIWSAACSSGQEPYSIGMILKEYIAGQTKHLIENFQILATDISPAALDEAKEALYDKIALSRGLSEDRKIKFFRPKESHWQVRDDLRSIASFKELNLRQSYLTLGKFDVIFCRNVLIYFSDEIKRDILNRAARSLNPGGYLFVGGSETVSRYTDAFELVKSNGGFVNRLKK